MLYHMHMIKSNIPHHVHAGDAVKWLHDHVGSCVCAHDAYTIQGEGWKLTSVAQWDSHARMLRIHGQVQFDSGVSPDLITQFMLTWS